MRMMWSQPVTIENVRDVFPAPPNENPLGGLEPYWVLQSMGLIGALQILKHTPPGEEQQEALWLLRGSIDRALAAAPPIDDAERILRMSQTLAPYVPSSPDAVSAILKLAALTKDDVLFDLGSGDGRIVLAAAEAYGCKAVGFEVDGKLVEQSERVAQRRGIDRLVQFIHGDAEYFSWDEATVVTVFWVSSTMARLAPRLMSLKPGTQVISNTFPIKGWRPHESLKVGQEEIYSWIIGRHIR